MHNHLIVLLLQLTCDGCLFPNSINLKQTLVWGKIHNKTSASIQQAMFFHNLHFISLFLFYFKIPRPFLRSFWFSSCSQFIHKSPHDLPWQAFSRWGERPRGYILNRPLTFPPDDISNHFLSSFLPFCGCSSGQWVFQNSLHLKLPKQVASLVHLLFFCLHLLSCWLILAPLHSHQVKISSSNFLLCCYKAVWESPEECRFLTF